MSGPTIGNNNNVEEAKERRAPPAAADGAGPAPALHDAGFLAV